MAQKAPSKIQWRINHYISLFLGILLFIGANYIGYRHYYWKPVAANDYLQFSSQTLQILKSLPGEVKIYVFANDSQDPMLPVMDDLIQMLDRYHYQSGGKVVIKRIDPYIDMDEATRLVKEFSLASEENAVIVEYQGKNKVIKFDELADMDRSGMAFGQPPKITAFKGEQQVTSAIQALVEGKSSKVYFLTGHGEYDPNAALEDRLGYSGLATYIKRQNVEIGTINLAKTPAVPEDADLLIIAGPKNAYAMQETEILGGYLARVQPHPGRLMLLLDPDTKSGLEDLLKSYGVTFDDDLVAGTFQLSTGQTKTIAQAIIFDFGPSPVMEWARSQGVNLILGPARSLTVSKPDTGAAAVVTPLAIASDAFWGETNYKGGPLAFEEGKDKKGPLVIAASIDSGAVQGGQVNVGGLRVVAVGAAAFLSNQSLGGAQLDFFLNSMNWILGKDKALGITPKVAQEFKITLTPDQRSYLMLIILVIIPGAGVLSGILVWFRRRK